MGTLNPCVQADKRVTLAESVEAGSDLKFEVSTCDHCKDCVCSGRSVCVCVCVRACVRACVRVCVCVRVSGTHTCHATYSANVRRLDCSTPTRFPIERLQELYISRKGGSREQQVCPCGTHC